MYTAHVFATDPETGERIAISSQKFEVLAKAELYAQAEAHGLVQPVWEVTAELTVAQACNVVKASRNRAIYVMVQAPGSTGKEPQYVEQKAPGACTLLGLYGDATVSVTITGNKLLCGA